MHPLGEKWVDGKGREFSRISWATGHPEKEKHCAVLDFSNQK